MGWLSDFLAKSDIVARDETVKTDAEPMWEQQTGSERRMAPNPLTDTSWLKENHEAKTPAASDTEKPPWQRAQEAAHEPDVDPPSRGISPA